MHEQYQLDALFNIVSTAISSSFSIQYFCISAMQLKQAAERYSAHSNAPRDEQPTAQRANDQQYNYQYYEEYRRLYQTAFLLSLQLKQLSQTKQDLWLKLGKLQKKTQDFKDDIRGQPPQRKKRFRRTAQEIERRFICDVQKCHKCYGSEGSLQQHIKLKHPQLYESKSQYKHQSNDSEEAEDYQLEQ